MSRTRCSSAVAPLLLLIMAALPDLLGLPGAAALTDVKLQWAKQGWYNPSLVEHSGALVSAAKVTAFKRINQKTYWVNSLHMCTGSNSSDVQSMSCTDYDPWDSRRYQECEFDHRVRGGKLDTTGLGDVKVWRWPGKGVYAIFGRKPQRSAGSRFCTGFVVYHQFISLIQAEKGALDPDPWLLKEPLALLPASTNLYPSWQEYALEKNWMPFVHTDSGGNEHLYVTYTVQPHMVFEVLPGGSSEHRWTTHDAAMMSKFSKFDVHGGPPLAYVPGRQSASGRPYYLGIMHHIERFDGGRIRLYRHFAYKIAPEPPFQMTAVSDELPLVFNTTHKQKTAFIAFVCGLDVNPNGQVYISYGSADIEARLLTLPMQELEQLFSGAVVFRDIVVPYAPVVVNASALQRRPHLL